MVDWMLYALVVAGIVALLMLPFLAMELIRMARANMDLIERNGIQGMMFTAYDAKFPVSRGATEVLSCSVGVGSQHSEKIAVRGLERDIDEFIATGN